MSGSPVLRNVSVDGALLVLQPPRPVAPPAAKAAPGDGKPVRAQREAAPEPAVDAEQLRREAHAAGMKAGRQRGFEEGVQAGREQGREAVIAEHQGRIERFGALVEQLAEAIPRHLHDCEDDIVAIAFTAVCKLMGDMAPTRAGIAAFMRQAMAEMRTGPLAAVRLHPADLAIVRADPALAALTARLEGPGGVQWLVDEDAALGGCVLENPAGELDARLQTQLVRLRDHLLAVRNARRRTEQ